MIVMLFVFAFVNPVQKKKKLQTSIILFWACSCDDVNNMCCVCLFVSVCRVLDPKPAKRRASALTDKM